MIKKIIFLTTTLICINFFTKSVIANDTTETSELIPFHWNPISDVDKVMQFENPKKLTKRSIEQSKLAETHYIDGFNLMSKKEYSAAINEFKAAMKRYKRAKLSDDALNFIRVNMALCYVNTGNKEDKVVGERLLNLVTSRIYKDQKWTYNIAIAKNLVGNNSEAASLLSSIIRKDEFNFQAYVTLEEIYRSSGNNDDAEKVISRMNTAEAKLQAKKSKQLAKTKEIKTKENKKQTIVKPKGKRPDVANLNIQKKDDHIQFNKIDRIDERSMTQIQEGVAEYTLGVNALGKREPSVAQKHLKDSEKRLKRGKITPDGLNFCRANLAISLLATGEKRGVGQSKRYLKALTSKLYQNREWSYNMAVTHYAFADGSRGTVKKEYMAKAISLFQKAIKQDKLYLPSYENLIYIYKELDDEKKALKTYTALEKARKELMRSYSKEEQIARGNDPYVFRINLGTFGELETPADIFDEDYLITIPISDKNTAYLAGLFYTSNEAREYQKKMQEKGYNTCFIVAFKDGEKVEY
tara:strand:+ start:1373 stop:2947 length:1575 start_codon:yes stop_codon:yes gene_type:complete